MIEKSRVCVLVPAYNEEKNIGRVIRQIQALSYPVLAVDDGSTDGTAGILRSSNAHFIISSDNQGKGAAIRKGLEWVLTHDYQTVVIMDADGQHEASEIESFTQALETQNADVVVGNRMHRPQGMPGLRRFTNRLMSGLISGLAGQNIPDTQCGFRALTRKALANLRLRTDRYEIESEMLLEAARKKMKIASIPITSVYRDEISHIRPLQDTLRFLKFLFRFIFSNS